MLTTYSRTLYHINKSNYTVYGFKATTKLSVVYTADGTVVICYNIVFTYLYFKPEEHTHVSFGSNLYPRLIKILHIENHNMMNFFLSLIRFSSFIYFHKTILMEQEVQYLLHIYNQFGRRRAC